MESGRIEQQSYDNMEEGVEAMARRFGALIVIWLAMAGFGEEVATVRWTAGATNEKWTVAGGRMWSPVWPDGVIVCTEVSLSCSANAPTRWPELSFLKDGKTVAGPIRTETVQAVGKTETQTYTISRTRQANGIALSLVEDWHICEVTLSLVGSSLRAKRLQKRGLAIIIK